MFKKSLLLLTYAFSCAQVRAQPEAPIALNIEVANIVIYRSDVADATRFATEPGPTTPLPPDDTAAGMATIQLVNASIPGPAIQMPVR